MTRTTRRVGANERQGALQHRNRSFTTEDVQPLPRAPRGDEPHRGQGDEGRARRTQPRARVAGGGGRHHSRGARSRGVRVARGRSSRPDVLDVTFHEVLRPTEARRRSVSAGAVGGGRDAGGGGGGGVGAHIDVSSCVSTSWGWESMRRWQPSAPAAASGGGVETLAVSH